MKKLYLRIWQSILLGLGLASGSVSATTTGVVKPEAPPSLNDPSLQAPTSIQAFPQARLSSQASDLTLGVPTSTVDVDLGQVEFSDREATWQRVSAELPAAPQVDDAQPQQLDLEALPLDPELGELRLQELMIPETQSSDPELGVLKLRTDEAASTSSSGTSQVSDPELGDLYLRSPATAQQPDPELGELRLQERLDAEQRQLDPELGNIRLRPPVAQTPAPPKVYVQGRFDYFQSDNIFSGIDPIDDSLIRYGLTVWTAPQIGPKTYFIASVNGNLIRYADRDEFNYNELRFGASVYQQLSARMYGEFGWSNQQLFVAEDGDRFLNDHSLRLGLSRRDPLGRQWSLQSFYQLRWSLADPQDRSRVINAVGTSLVYNPNRRWEAGLDYQFVLSDFTKQDRQDDYHQVLARLSYSPTRNSQLTVFGGFGFGRSSNPNVDFNSSILGISLFMNLPLF